ncbi:MAG: leucine-rich repeat domain-containing protein [Candidatus Hydrogenedentes bacterium]|nr:leucine-rich repeat domain-containing protein [Candidatus Hydrogenedentota bacterium]
MRLQILVMAGLALMLGSCSLFGPVADFEAAVTEGDLPLTVTFQDRSDTLGDQILSWNWTFGDGGTSTARNPVYTYQNRGTYSVTLRIETVRGTGIRFRQDYIQVRQIVRFPDTRLDAALRGALGIPSASIRVADLERLTAFDATGAGISNLSGLEHATNLKTLILESNAITDIGPLASLRGLEALNLRNNNVRNLSPIANLTNLHTLDLGVNAVSNIRPLEPLARLALLNLEQNPDLEDIRTLRHLTALRELSLAFTGIRQSEVIDGAGNGDALVAIAGLTGLVFLDLAATDIYELRSLAGLTNLEELVLFECLIQNIGPLAELVNLRALQLSANQIVTVDALAGLERLQLLTLQRNQIQNISPLVRNAGLGRNDILRLTGNPLNTVSLCNAIPTLELRGVLVEVDQRCGLE